MPITRYEASYKIYENTCGKIRKQVGYYGKEISRIEVKSWE